MAAYYPFARWLPAACLLVGLAGPALAQGEVIARVGDAEITQEDLAVAAEDLSGALQQLSPDQQRDYLITYLADLEVIAGVAEEAGIDDDPELARRLDYLRKRTLMEVYLARHGEEAANEAAARELYDEVIDQVPAEAEVRASHILVETEDEANDIKRQLDEGGDFASLATEHSTDPGSGPQGGDLGYFTQEQMVPAFGAAAFALEPGEVSDPVETQFGWHVIRLDDRRERPKPSFEEVEGELMTMLARQAQRERIMELRAGAEIERLDQPAPEAEPGADAPAAPAAEGSETPAAE